MADELVDADEPETVLVGEDVTLLTDEFELGEGGVVDA